MGAGHYSRFPITWGHLSYKWFAKCKLFLSFVILLLCSYIDCFQILFSKMGITDIFEPNRADFRSMTDEKGTYIKHIQQSIKIHIRTHPINQIKGKWHWFNCIISNKPANETKSVGNILAGPNEAYLSYNVV